MDRDYILCECPLEKLIELVDKLEKDYEIKVTQMPNICLTMISAQDSVEDQDFYLGEALTTVCEIAIGNTTGYGIVLEDQPERAYCLAVIDALEKIRDYSWPLIETFLWTAWQEINQKERKEHAKIMESAVDFKLMEEA